MKIKMKAIGGISVLLSLCLFPFGEAFCDTVIKKDKERIKGVIVEDYKDRLVISTIDGEIEIMRSDIFRTEYDIEEQNLTSMGDLYLDRKRYPEAYYYYSQALKINPNYKIAREGLDYAGSMMQQFSRKRKLEHISRMNDETSWRAGVKVEEADIEQQFRELLGFSAEPYGVNFKVTDLKIPSPASDAGLKEGDVIVAVWGRRVGYTRQEDFVREVISSEMMEVRFAISRKIEMPVGSGFGGINALMGANVGYSETEGFQISSVLPGGEADKAGIIPGDVIMEIEGASTRYMPREQMEKYFSEKKGSMIGLGILRNVSIWKRFEKK